MELTRSRWTSESDLEHVSGELEVPGDALSGDGNPRAARTKPWECAITRPGMGVLREQGKGVEAHRMEATGAARVPQAQLVAFVRSLPRSEKQRAAAAKARANGVSLDVSRETSDRLATYILGLSAVPGAACESEKEKSKPEEIQDEELAKTEALVRVGRLMSPREIAERMLAAGDSVLLWGPEGTGKSTLAREIADSDGRKVYVVGPCHRNSDRIDLYGYTSVTDGTYQPSAAYRAWTEGGLLLVEELDNGADGFSVTLNLILDSVGQGVPIDWPNGDRSLAADGFAIIATANTPGLGATMDFAARNALDRATRSRFCPVFVPLDEQLEDKIVAAIATTKAELAVITQGIARLRALREHIANEQESPSVTLGMRSAIRFARAIVAGLGVMQAWEVALLSGLDSDARARYLRAIGRRDA